ncbi:hypothetical protein HG536_0E01330 [Torulaspora globosa]|uniref:C2H2-type domain-containing protein n=1 Tax=Torulaspora globosa TaxID=48254 RepID=A0A7G3ZI86_9SACH|nr:uncharacterized protein HG536_0E01330 [Torulaspora globosa]QLL33222.1 hypothetical protein HG536_0E01330 [Torulaspora globosa]
MSAVSDNNSGLQKKYACSYCGKPFSRSEHKARHERSHTGVKPFECKVCQHAFVRRDLLQRHIRTVHREVLLLGKSAKEAEIGHDAKELAAEMANTSKGDILLELLVNSMIKVNYDNTPDTRDSKCLRSVPKIVGLKGRRRKWKNGPIGELSRRDARAVSICINKSIGIDRIRLLYRCAVGHVAEHKLFNKAIESHVRDEPPLAASVVCLGLHLGDPDDRIAKDIWHALWNISLERCSVTAANLLIYILVTFAGKTDWSMTSIGDVFSRYERFFIDHLVQYSETFEMNEISLIFHIWVSLLRLSQEPTSLSARIYTWFLQHAFLKDCTLKDLVFQIMLNNNRWEVPTLDLLADALFGDWLISSRLMESNDPLGASHIFKTGAEFHNTVTIVLKKYAAESGNQEELMRQLRIGELPSKFSFPLSQYLARIQSNSHWRLLETAWCRLIERMKAKQDRSYWFMDSMAEFPTIFLESSMIDETFATCCIPVFTVLESKSDLNANYVPLISDVVVFLIRLFEFEMSINSNKYCPHRLISMLKNPVIQLLLFTGHRLTSSGIHSQQESIAVDHFINRYIVNCNWLVDKHTEEELTHNLFDSQSLGYIGYHQLIQDFLSYLRNSIITEKLMKVPHISHDIKVHLFDFAQQHCHNLHHPTQDVHAARRLTDPWQSSQPGPVWMFSPQSPRSMSIDSTGTEPVSILSTGMSQSNSLDSTMLHDPNVILPPLNETLLLRQQQKSSYYNYGPGSVELQMNRRPSSIVPIFTNPNFSNMDGVFLDKGENESTSPRSNVSTTVRRIGNNSVKLPPPSELFG